MTERIENSTAYTVFLPTNDAISEYLKKSGSVSMVLFLHTWASLLTWFSLMHCFFFLGLLHLYLFEQIPENSIVYPNYRDIPYYLVTRIFVRVNENAAYFSCYCDCTFTSPLDSLLGLLS